MITTQTAALLLVAGLAFLIPLAGYALHLHLEAKRQTALAKEKHEAEEQQARTRLLENLSVLARALLDDQMNLTEGCLRIRVLLDLLEEGRHVHEQTLVIFDEVYQKAQHLATHQAREDLPLVQREKEDQQRRALEGQYEGRIKQGAQALIAFCDDQGAPVPQSLFVNAAANTATGTQQANKGASV